ncbi:hypothetical protein INR49_011335 [Caranx melampygus]|nr:hypothetical protein INR49_011335 [Caranx melampygus]
MLFSVNHPPKTTGIHRKCETDSLIIIIIISPEAPPGKMWRWKRCNQSTTGSTAGDSSVTSGNWPADHDPSRPNGCVVISSVFLMLCSLSETEMSHSH